MAEITGAGRTRELEELWRLDDRFYSPPGQVTLIGASRVEKSYEGCITERSSYRILPDPFQINELSWRHFVPVPTRRYISILCLITPSNFRSGDYLEVQYWLRTREEEQRYKVQFLLQDGAIRYYDYRDIIINITDTAPKVISGSATELEIMLNIEAKRYEAVRIGRERFTIRQAGIVGANAVQDSLAAITLVYKKNSANSGKIYLDHMSYSQS